MSYIEELQREYYNGTPLISNEEYDALVRKLGEESIGHAGDIKHHYRMSSLRKVFKNRGDKLPDNLTAYVKTPKLDGCAVSLLYYKGNFVRGLTRGDGHSGKDVTDKLKHLVPLEIDDHADYLQVTGEVVTSRDVPNMRNFASGALNTKEVAKFLVRKEQGGLQFIAYAIVAKGLRFETYTESLVEAANLGFATVMDVDSENLPTDGEVYRIDNMSIYDSMGSTAKYPHGAFAVKEDVEGVPTVLRDIEWVVGKSGKVTPTAVFDPIKIGDATVRRCTLNNPGFIKAMGITDIGQTIYIIKSGEIIPCCVGSDPYVE